MAVVLFVLITPCDFWCELSLLPGLLNIWLLSCLWCYILLTVAIMVINYDTIIPNLILIIKSAFVPTAAFSGIGAGIFAALINGIKRGLFF